MTTRKLVVRLRLIFVKVVLCGVTYILLFVSEENITQSINYNKLEITNT